MQKHTCEGRTLIISVMFTCYEGTLCLGEAQDCIESIISGYIQIKSVLFYLEILACGKEGINVTIVCLHVIYESVPAFKGRCIRGRKM